MYISIKLQPSPFTINQIADADVIVNNGLVYKDKVIGLTGVNFSELEFIKCLIKQLGGVK